MPKTSKASATIDNAIAAAKEAAALLIEPPKEPGIGHNAEAAGMLLPAPDLVEHLKTKYAPLESDVAKLLANIAGRTEGVVGAPIEITSEADDGIIAAYMDDLRKTEATADGFREVENRPYVQGHRASQGHFAAILVRLAKTKEILQARGDRWTTKKAALERVERQRIADAEAAAAKDASRLAAIAAAEAIELEQKAARARKPENIERLGSYAAEKIAEADVRAAEAMAARDNAAAAATHAAASTADMARTRFDTGHMATGKQVGYVDILDVEKIDLNRLRPYIKIAIIQKALEDLAKQHDFNIKIEGAEVGKRYAAVYR